MARVVDRVSDGCERRRRSRRWKKQRKKQNANASSPTQKKMVMVYTHSQRPLGQNVHADPPLRLCWIKLHRVHSSVNACAFPGYFVSQHGCCAYASMTLAHGHQARPPARCLVYSSGNHFVKHARHLFNILARAGSRRKEWLRARG